MLTELDLPTFAANPDKTQLVPLSKVTRDLSHKKRIDPAVATATVTYDRRANTLVWHFEQPLPGGGAEVKIATVDVDAHTGAILAHP